MLRWIEKTRNKPKSVRNQYAFIGAVGLTGLIALIWTLSIPAHFAKVNLSEDETTKETVGAFSQFFNDAKQNIASVIDASKSVDEEQETEITNEPETPDTFIDIPELTEETIEEVKLEQEVLAEPKPRTVLIATTSKDHTETVTEE